MAAQSSSREDEQVFGWKGVRHMLGNLLSRYRDHPLIYRVADVKVHLARVASGGESRKFGSEMEREIRGN